MDYSKNIYLKLALFAIFILGCSTNQEENNEPLEISITNLKTSYSQVKINWKIKRPQGIIIQELLVYRQSKNNNTDFYQEELLANLPSNETEFIDNNVPYKTEVSYKIKFNYTDERTNPISHLSLESEQQKFIRELVTFDKVPFQVQKDPLQTDIFHIFDKSNSTLSRYNSAQNKITDTKTFTENWTLNNRFQIINNTDIYVATYYGKIYKINAASYHTVTIFSTAIVDNLNSFAVDGDRIYYQDDEILKYHTMTTNISKSMNMGMGFQYLENLSPGIFLFLYNNSGYNSGASVSQTTGNCPDGADCYLRSIAATALLPANAIDPNIFAWNTQKVKFISSIDGCIFNLATLQQEKKLNDITGKHYIQ